MSDATTTTTPHGVLRLLAEDQASHEWVAMIWAAVREGTAVHVFLIDGDAVPWFKLQPRGDAILVLDGSGRYSGTFASVEAAVSRGWTRGGWGGV